MLLGAWVLISRAIPCDGTQRVQLCAVFDGNLDEIGEKQRLGRANDRGFQSTSVASFKTQLRGTVAAALLRSDSNVA
jgi:hypothetical protein